MKEIKLVNLDSYQDLARLQKEITKMNMKIKNWLLYLCFILEAISYVAFALTREYEYFSISCAIIFALLMIPCVYLGIRKFDQVVARSIIFPPENRYSPPQSDYEKYCIQICFYVEIVNGQIEKYNELITRVEDQQLVEFASAIENKKSFLGDLLGKLYRAKSKDFDSDVLKSLIAVVEEKIQLENQARAITAE